MAQAAQHVESAGQAITTIRNQVAEAVTATSGGYQSDAANLFRSVMDQWGQDLQTIIGGLDRIGQALTGTKQNYEGAMSIDGQSANRIAALLNGTDV